MRFLWFPLRLGGGDMRAGARGFLSVAGIMKRSRDGLRANGGLNWDDEEAAMGIRIRCDVRRRGAGVLER